MITSNVLGNTQQYLKENPAIRSRCFTYSFSHRILFYHFFSSSNGQRKITFMVYMVYLFLSFCYVIHYIRSEICIAGRLLEDCFYCCSQSIISEESLIPYNRIQCAPETQNL